jgi:outer membrane immunogenic protein
MQKILAVAVMATALGIGGASAADLNSRSMKDVPAYVPGGVWSGFYVGGNGGYGWSGKNSDILTDAYHDYNPTEGYDSAALSTQGGFGGGQIGYNIQKDRLVFGIEADFQGSDVKGSKSSAALDNYQDQDVLTGATVSSTLDWFGTVRARLGYATGNSLVYVTGGLAYGGVKDTLVGETISVHAVDSAVLADSRSATLTGYTVGGGIETMLTPAWSVKAEYLYIDLGSTSHLFSEYEFGNLDYGAAGADISHTYNVVRAGLNYKINQAPEPLK